MPVRSQRSATCGAPRPVAPSFSKILNNSANSPSPRQNPYSVNLATTTIRIWPGTLGQAKHDAIFNSCRAFSTAFQAFAASVAAEPPPLLRLPSELIALPSVDYFNNADLLETATAAEPGASPSVTRPAAGLRSNWTCRPALTPYANRWLAKAGQPGRRGEPDRFMGIGIAYVLMIQLQAAHGGMLLWVPPPPVLLIVIPVV